MLVIQHPLYIWLFSLHGIIVVQIETNCLADLSNQLMSYMYLHGDNSDSV